MSGKSTESIIDNNCNNCNYKNECDIFHYGDIINLKFTNEIIDNQRRKIRELTKENEIYKQTLIDFGYYFLVHW